MGKKKNYSEWGAGPRPPGIPLRAACWDGLQAAWRELGFSGSRL